MKKIRLPLRRRCIIVLSVTAWHARADIILRWKRALDLRHGYFNQARISPCYASERNGVNTKSDAVSKEHFDAVLFDLDGVITDTAKIHAACWKKAFDAFLKKRAEKINEYATFE